MANAPLQSLRALRQSDYRVMPWKNGGGTTTEIALDPPGAALDDFAWRLSLATLGGSGPFSSFPRHDRIIVQLDGAPMTLTHAEHEGRELELLVPYRFDGAWTTAASLTAAPARDFNIMTRKDLLRSTASVHRLAPGASVQLSERAETVVAYVLEGRITTQLEGQADKVRAERGDSVFAVAEGGAELSLRTEQGAVVLVAALAKR